MKLVLLANVGLYDGAVALVEVSQDLEELFIGFVDAPDQIRQFVLLEVFAEGSQAVLHELVDLDGVVVFVVAVDRQADRANQSAVLAVGIDANKGGVLAVGMAIVRFDEILEALGKLLDVCFDRHQLQLLYPPIHTSYQLHKSIYTIMQQSQVHLHSGFIELSTSQHRPLTHDPIASQVHMLKAAFLVVGQESLQRHHRKLSQPVVCDDESLDIGMLRNKPQKGVKGIVS